VLCPGLPRASIGERHEQPLAGVDLLELLRPSELLVNGDGLAGVMGPERATHQRRRDGEQAHSRRVRKLVISPEVEAGVSESVESQGIVTAVGGDVADWEVLCVRTWWKGIGVGSDLRHGRSRLVELKIASMIHAGLDRSVRVFLSVRLSRGFQIRQIGHVVEVQGGDVTVAAIDLIHVIVGLQNQSLWDNKARRRVVGENGRAASVFHLRNPVLQASLHGIHRRGMQATNVLSLLPGYRSPAKAGVAHGAQEWGRLVVERR
jgi:hypothetical protein